MSTLNVLVNLPAEGIWPRKPVKGSAMAFQGIHHIHSCHSLPVAICGVYYHILYNMFEEDLKDSTALLKCIPRHSFHTSSPRHPAKYSLRYSVNGILQSSSHPLHSWFWFRCFLGRICIYGHTLS